jgi:hypothetical protein
MGMAALPGIFESSAAHLLAKNVHTLVKYG